VKSALLWYEMTFSRLKYMGFVLNPYDPCIANFMIDEKQCTVAWYVDDNKISHEDPRVVSMIIDCLEEYFGKVTVTRGKEHVFLGMKIRFTMSQTVVLSMKNYLEEAIKECGMNIMLKATTLAKRTLFEVDSKSSTMVQNSRKHILTG